MSGNKLIDDYLSDLMDDDTAAPPAAAPEPAAATPEPAAAPEPAAPEAKSDAKSEATSGHEPPHGDDAEHAGANHADAATQAADAADMPRDADSNAPGPAMIVDDTSADAAPAGDPLAAFRDGGRDIGEDEFEAMLDALQGKTPPPSPPMPAAVEPAAESGDPLASFREGGRDIGDDEFEAMLDVLGGKAPPPAAPTPAPAPPVAATPAPLRSVPRPVRPVPTQELLPPAIAEMLAPEPGAHSEPAMSPEPRRERHRRADERVASWLRFNIGRQHFAVEVLKVQEVLRLPMIMPVRGTERAMLGVMNLRGQIVPILDLAIRLGFPSSETTESSRVIVLEESGETLGLLVASVADVTNVSDAKIERISGTTSLVAADVVRGIARREGNIIIMLDASRLLA